MARRTICFWLRCIPCSISRTVGNSCMQRWRKCLRMTSHSPEGRSDMRETWKELRRSILERDNFLCQFCGLGGKSSDIILEIDHILERSRGGTDDPSNLRVLCSTCHKLRHGKIPRVDNTFSSRRRRKKERRNRGR